MTHTLDTITFSSVISKETVHIALTMVALHDLKVKVADVLNIIVIAPSREKIWTVLGSDFGGDAGNFAIFVRVLYSLNIVDASFRAHFAQCMWESWYQSCDADPDLWMKPEYRPEEKLEYYLYIYILCG